MWQVGKAKTSALVNRQARNICAVDIDFAGIDAATDQIALERMRQRGNPRRMAIEEQLNLFVGHGCVPAFWKRNRTGKRAELPLGLRAMSNKIGDWLTVAHDDNRLAALDQSEQLR